MRFGFRAPSLKKRIAARTSLQRYVRHSLGFKAPRGFGILTNPKKSMYNKIYCRTTIGLEDLLKTGQISLSDDELRELDKESNLELGKDTKKESMPASTEKRNTPAWVQQVITAGNGVVPIFTTKILGELPISSRTEAKKVYRALLERYHIVDLSEVARCVDMLSHDIEIAVWGVRDDVGYMRETIRDIKTQLKEAQLKLRKATGMEKKYVLNQIDELKKDLSKYEDEMADAINIRDSFLRDKRDYIANHINRLAHGDDWAFTPGPVKYFIYRDAEGKITARSITNMQSDIESVTGHCSTRNAERTFKRCRILEHASDQNDLFERLKKYDSAEVLGLGGQQGQGPRI
jgi:hypothetical protein